MTEPDAARPADFLPASHTRADTTALLATRARTLAIPLDSAIVGTVASSGDELLVFRVGNEQMAVAMTDVIAIARLRQVTPLPGASAPLAGVAAWRGRIVTVLDLRVGGPDTGDTIAPDPRDEREKRMIVFGDGRTVLGLVADDVDELRTLGDGELLPAPELSAARAELVRGVTPDALVVLDAAAVLRRFAT